MITLLQRDFRVKGEFYFGSKGPEASEEKIMFKNHLPLTFAASLLLAAACITTARAQQNNNYLGIHMLYLSSLNDTSVDNLNGVLTASGAPNHIQVTCVPAFFSDGASASAAWGNLDKVAKAVIGSGRTLTLGIAMSFHTTSTDLQGGADIDHKVVYNAAITNLAEFYQRHLTTISSGSLKVVILPSLEDDLKNTNQFVALAKAIVAKLRTELTTLGVSGVDSVIVRRSGSNGTFSELKQNCGDIAGNTGLKVSCQWEVHLPPRIPPSSGTVWSNDGNFVYADIHGLTWGENKDSSTSHGQPTPLTAFTAEAAASSPVTMLWRPAFNLHMRHLTNCDSHHKNCTVNYDSPQDKTTHQIRNRFDDNSDKQGAFIGSQEVTVLRYFISHAPHH